MTKEKNTSHTIKKLFLASCFDEIKADKPGNVSINSPIIGLKYQKFFRAAEITANIISNNNYSLGEIIFKSCHSCMNELNSNYNLGIKELENYIKDFFDKDGFPLSRNPEDLLYTAKYLVFCKKIIEDAQKYVPEFLENIIEKNIVCLNFIRNPNNQLPLFNGASENFINQFDEHLSATQKKFLTQQLEVYLN